MLGSEGFIVPLIWTRRSSSKKEANINNIQAAAASEVKKMAATSSSVPFYGIREEEQYNAQPQAPPPPSQQQQATAAPPKKKRNLPGNPNPDAEVIALSPKTLLATNRFICEVCNKGFQREQNLQLHRRGHNLPWKLKQKNPKEVRRRVYICPEPTCVHHEPSRALGDLTGIKKHFCRKHGEKKWKCDKCSKRYAVQSDWKAHSKTCGTREYRCDCGTLFSRRDSFITHRAFCDALAQESARLPNAMNSMGGHLYGSNPGLVNLSLPLVNPQFSSLQDQTVELSGNGNTMQFDHLTLPSFRQSQQLQQGGTFYIGGGSGGGGSGGGGGSTQTINDDTQLLQSKPFHGLMQLQDLHPNATNASAAAAANIFNLNINNNSSSNNNAAMNQSSNLLMSDQFNNINVPSGRDEPISATFAGNLMSNHNFDPNMSSIPPHMSATALLQKAAQMGATSSGGGGGGGGGASSLLKGFGSFYSGDAKNEGHFHDLMNSWANGGGNEQETGYGGFGHGINVSNMINESKLQRNLSVGGLSGSDRLSTRDFLGVGNLMRSMHGGGMTKRDHQQQHLGIDMGSLDSELKSGSSSRSFAGGTLQ